MKIGDCVEYNNEFGIIIEISKTDDNGKYLSGDLLVRWDSPNKNDIESCIGNLEGLLKIVKQHPFKFIKEQCYESIKKEN
ncbi:hypothetical protein [Olleya sp. ITB9]|uniref:hypothetical protein n=1 Tax=Olleya sp. ITB9 TaxID=1715648 RepID=UPI0006CF534B|nr:hypothetical protein [Olleya sp. ITB9]